MRACVGLLLLSVGCRAPSIQGAETVPAGREPAARILASFLTTGCVDSAGGPFTHAARVFLAEEDARRRLLVVTRPSHDSLVIRAARSEAEEHVFQAILQDSSGRRVLHDYRLPERGGGGRMAVSTGFSPLPAGPGQVAAQPGRPDFSCRLTPEAPSP